MRVRESRFCRTLLAAALALSCNQNNHKEPEARTVAPLAGGSVSASASAGLPGPKAEHPAFGERTSERDRMVKVAIEGAGVKDPRVLAAMRRVPRHAFVPRAWRDDAYANRPLPIGHAQTISQPYIVAAMTAAVLPKSTDRCLEIGTGSGYQAAVLAEVCKSVYSIEYLPDVAEFGAQNLRTLGYLDGRVHLRVGDGYLGWPEAAPFDVIVVTAAPDHVPKPLLEQLAPGGRLVIPVGPEYGAQELERWTRIGEGTGAAAFRREGLMGVRFVPFLGDRAGGSK